MKKGFKIKEIHAFIATEDDGTEGIISQYIGSAWMPFVCADADRVESLRPIAKQLAKHLEKPVKLIRFSVREDLETI